MTPDESPKAKSNGGVFNKTIIPLALVGYEMIVANSALRASLAMYIEVTSWLVSADDFSSRVARGANERVSAANE